MVWVDEKATMWPGWKLISWAMSASAAGCWPTCRKGTSFVFEQAYMNNEVWLPTYEEAHVGVRFLLVKGFKVNAVTRYSDYKRFNVETLNTIDKAKRRKAEDAKPEARANTCPRESAIKSKISHCSARLLLLFGEGSGRTCATRNYCAGVWLRTSRTFCASTAGEKGFCRNARPFSSMPPAGDDVVRVAGHIKNANIAAPSRK